MTSLFQKIKASYFKSLKGEENFWVSVWLWSILFYHGFFVISAFCAMAFDIFIKTKMPDISLVIIILFLFFNFPYLVRSARNVLSGKERLWKVFWLWVVVLYFGDIFFMFHDPLKINYGFFPVLLSIYKNYVGTYNIMYINLILVPFLALILKKNFENLDIKEPYLKKITLFLPFMLVFLMCMARFYFICFSFIFVITGNGNLPTLITAIFLFHPKVFRDFYRNLKY